MKPSSRYRFASFLVIGVAVFVAVLILFPRSQNPGTPSSATNRDASPQPGGLANQKNSRNPRKESQSGTQWLAELSESKTSIHEKLAQLQSGLPRHDILALWNEMLAAGTWVRNGQLPGAEKWESEMIFNALLDALVERGAPRNGAGAEQDSAAVAAIFGELIGAHQCDGVIRDYAIQRGLMLAADSLPPENPGRTEIIEAGLAQLTPGNIGEFHLGTALNTFLSFKSQWTEAERTRIQDSINHLILDLPRETTDRFTQETDVPTLQVRIPLLTAIGAWAIEPGLPLLDKAIRSEKPALQIPAIAAWSQLPVEMRSNSDIRAQIETWASSDNSLRFAAANAIRSTEIHNP